MLSSALRVCRSDRRDGSARTHVYLALLVIDIVESTELLRSLGDEHYASLVEGFKDSVYRVMSQRPGREIADTGDGFIYAFENGSSAISAAADLYRVNTVLDESRERPIPFRCGVHAGSLVVSRYGIVGLALYEAVELGNAAGSGELWVSIPALQSAELSDRRPCRVDLPRSGPTEVVVLKKEALVGKSKCLVDAGAGSAP